MFKKLMGMFGGSSNQQPEPIRTEDLSAVPFRDGRSPAMQEVLDRTMPACVEQGAAIEEALVKKLGPGYRMGVNVHKAIIALAKAGSSKVEFELPVFILGTELPEPEGCLFVFPWAHAMYGLPPFPVWTEFANEVQTIGGGADGIEEFRTPALKYRSVEELNYFYNAIQGWSKLPAFYRLVVGQSSVVVFLERDALSRIS